MTKEEIIKTKEPRVIVSCPPASGKTFLITERAKYLISIGVRPSQIVIITFTNAAAAEMKKRIGEIGDNCHIQTIHSYCNYLLTKNLIDTSNIIQTENFDELFELIKQHPDCAEPVEHLLLDEAQDTDESQFEFIERIVHPKNIFYVGDLRQSIYSFRMENPNIFSDMIDSCGYEIFELDENYRNSIKIHQFAKRIIDALGGNYIDNSKCVKTNNGIVVEIDYNPANIAYYILNSTAKFSDWFVLTRTNAELDEIKTALEKRGIPCESFKRANLDNDDLMEKMENNTVKVLTIHAAKGLEAKFVVVIGARFYNKEEKRIAYVAATRAKDGLIWCKPIKKKKTKFIF